VKLQIPFDFIDLDEGLRIEGETSPYADWLEIGTSLIKNTGIIKPPPSAKESCTM